MNKDTASNVLRRLDALKALRRPHESVWRQCFEYSYPLRGAGFVSDLVSAEEARRMRAELLDSTSTDAARILASGIMSGITPANSRWFQLDAGEESDDERRWLDACAQTLWENIHVSNFDAAAYEALIDVVCAGWFALYVDEMPGVGGLRFSQWPLSGVYVASTNSAGSVDTVYRVFKLSAEQAATEFGEEKLSERTLKLAREKPDEKIDFVHAITPRGDEGKRDGKLARDLPFASVHVEVGEKRLVRESGYHEMPVIVPRWMLIPDSAYGVGPVFDALPDIKMLNKLKEMELASAELSIAGMWIAEDDGVLNPRAVKVGPRKIIVANSVDSMKPLQTGANFELSEILAEQLQRSIRKVLMADQLQPQNGPQMTATEVHVRVNLIRQLLGPIYGRLQAEYLQPLIERCFGLAWRAGVFGPAPESLAGREFSIRYLSPLARAQKLDDVTAIERYIADVASFAQIFPELVDQIDGARAGRRIAEGLGVPSDVTRSDDEVARVRDERARQAAQEKAMTRERQGGVGGAMLEKVMNSGGAR
ncbi:MAG: head-tail connector protein [Candidatus Accumulibacter sp.]|jgi:hypothetical protein|nr:head-tail connector protein [Accumulibacter sp.]